MKKLALPAKVSYQTDITKFRENLLQKDEIKIFSGAPQLLEKFTKNWAYFVFSALVPPRGSVLY